MLNIKKKGKNIVEVTNGKDKHTFELSLDSLFSYGLFSIGASISNYQNIIKEDPIQYGEWDTNRNYYATNVDYELCLAFSNTGLLQTISFYEHCYFKGRDLIGMNIFSFLSLINKEPEKVDIDWIPTKDENHGQNHHCYVFYYPQKKVLQLWTWRKRINNIMIFDYSID
jgi:hypothetical protein